MDDFVKFIAENWENESEYAGRMETWCFYCGKYQEPREPFSHNEGCLHVKALAIVNAAEQMRAADGAKLSPIERDWSGEVEDKAWAYLQKPPRR